MIRAVKGRVSQTLYGPDDIFQLNYIVYKINILYIQKVKIMQNETSVSIVQISLIHLL